MQSFTVGGVTFNDGAYDPVSNPYGFGDGGHSVNFFQLLNLLQAGLVANPDRNLLDNGAFRIDQRNLGASTAIADDVYGPDRWYALNQTAAVNHSQQTEQENGTPHNWRITQNQASAQRCGLAQIIEGVDCKQARGQSVTLSGRLRCSAAQAIRYAILEWTGTEDTVTSDVVLDWTSASYAANAFFLAASLTVAGVGSITPGAATWTPFSLTASVSASAKNLIVFVWTEAVAAQNVTLDLARMQLQVSAAASNYRTEPLALGLMRCRRHYFATDKLASRAFASGFCNTTTSFRGIFTLPVEMRVAPTLAVSAAGDFTVFIKASTQVDVTALSANTTSKQAIDLVATVASGLTAGEGANLRDDAGANARLTFAADL